MMGIRNVFHSLIFAVVLTPTLANAGQPFDDSPEALDAHLSLNGHAMTCEALGQASMLIAAFTFELGLLDPKRSETIIVVMENYLKNKPIRPVDVGEVALNSALSFILKRPKFVAAILEAIEDPETKRHARLMAHNAIASQCAAFRRLPDGINLVNAKNEIVAHFRESRSDS